MNQTGTSFVGQSEDGNVVKDHPLLPSTLGIIDKSMVPADILEAAPDIG